MKYVLFKGPRVVSVTTETPYTGTPELKKFPGIEYDRAESRWDWTSLEQVQGLAMFVTAISGEDHIGTDSGPNVSPRFDIVRAPRVGDDVSYSFNGDTYPCGTIVRITDGGMAITSTGKRFNRYKNSGSWLMVGGTWSMVHGHYTERNESF